MHLFKRMCQYPLCVVGLHAPPPRRYPHGPVVANCGCCGKTCYFYGLSVYGLSSAPVILPYHQPVKVITR